jgi:L-seryl-tRNA(Ser) seleniumtransferase
VTFSGDKLLGGPQAGLAAGARALVEPMRRNPLYRALRVDKMTLAALDATLVEHEGGHATASVPVLKMIHAPLDDIRARAESWARRLTEAAPEMRLRLLEAHSAVGGGAAPTVGIPTIAVSVTHPRLGAERLAAALRAGTPPVIARVAGEQLLLDLRTVPPEDEETLVEALVAAARG